MGINAALTFALFFLNGIAVYAFANNVLSLRKGLSLEEKKVLHDGPPKLSEFRDSNIQNEMKAYEDIGKRQGDKKKYILPNLASKSHLATKNERKIMPLFKMSEEASNKGDVKKIKLRRRATPWKGATLKTGYRSKEGLNYLNDERQGLKKQYPRSEHRHASSFIPRRKSSHLSTLGLLAFSSKSESSSYNYSAMAHKETTTRKLPDGQKRSNKAIVVLVVVFCMLIITVILVWTCSKFNPNFHRRLQSWRRNGYIPLANMDEEGCDKAQETKDAEEHSGTNASISDAKYPELQEQQQGQQQQQQQNVDIETIQKTSNEETNKFLESLKSSQTREVISVQNTEAEPDVVNHSFASIQMEPISLIYMGRYDGLCSNSGESYSSYERKNDSESDLSDWSDSQCSWPRQMAKTVVRNISSKLSCRRSQEHRRKSNEMNDIVIVDKTRTADMMNHLISPPTRVQIQFKHGHTRNNTDLFKIKSSSDKNTAAHPGSSSDSDNKEAFEGTGLHSVVTAGRKLREDSFNTQSVVKQDTVKRPLSGISDIKRPGETKKVRRSLNISENIERGKKRAKANVAKEPNSSDFKLSNNSHGLEVESKINDVARYTQLQRAVAKPMCLNSQEQLGDSDAERRKAMHRKVGHNKELKDIGERSPSIDCIDYSTKRAFTLRSFDEMIQADHRTIIEQAKRQMEAFDAFQNLLYMEEMSSTIDTTDIKNARKEEPKAKCEPMFVSLTTRGVPQRPLTLRPKSFDIKDSRSHSETSVYKSEIPEFCNSIWTANELLSDGHGEENHDIFAGLVIPGKYSASSIANASQESQANTTEKQTISDFERSDTENDRRNKNRQTFKARQVKGDPAIVAINEQSSTKKVELWLSNGTFLSNEQSELCCGKGQIWEMVTRPGSKEISSGSSVWDVSSTSSSSDSDLTLSNITIRSPSIDSHCGSEGFLATGGTNQLSFKNDNQNGRETSWFQKGTPIPTPISRSGHLHRAASDSGINILSYSLISTASSKRVRSINTDNFKPAEDSIANLKGMSHSLKDKRNVGVQQVCEKCLQSRIAENRTRERLTFFKKLFRSNAKSNDNEIKGKRLKKRTKIFKKKQRKTVR